ncbi:MAG: hypothetical protein GXX85_15130 [Ignavibacteria bacterium]|nr:hypothetical protein [Ignavibacteria bacterium]
MKITDEILNRYIDGSLNADEVKQLSAELENNEESLKKLRALQTVHSSLFKIKTSEAPETLTLNIMNKILKKERAVVKEKVFFRFASFIFGVSILTTIVLGFYSANNVGTKTNPVTQNLLIQIQNITADFSVKINPEILKAGSLILAFVLIIVLFFIYENHKRFVKYLNRY